MAKSNAGPAKAELAAICERYIKSIRASKSPSAEAVDCAMRMESLLQNSKLTAQDLLQALYKKHNTQLSIVSEIKRQKPIKTFFGGSFWRGGWGLLTFLLATLIGLTFILSRVVTGKWNPWRLYQSKQNLFIDDLKAAKARYHLSSYSRSAPASAVYMPIPNKAPSHRTTLLDVEDDALGVIMSHLSVADASIFGQANKRLYGLFQERKMSDRLVVELLTDIAQGKQYEAEQIIQQHPELLFKKSRVKDYSGRVFDDVSPLQLAAWNWDVDMLNMMKPYIEKVSDGNMLANRQLEQLDKEGIRYTYKTADGKIRDERSSHFAMSHLHKAYKKHTNLSNFCSSLSMPVFVAASPILTFFIIPSWLKVGSEQSQLPACFVQAYMQSYAFNPVPSQQRLSADLIRHDVKKWFSSKLGIEHAFYRGNKAYPEAQTFAIFRIRQEKRSYDALCKTRKNRINEFRDSLRVSHKSSPQIGR